MAVDAHHQLFSLNRDLMEQTNGLCNINQTNVVSPFPATDVSSSSPFLHLYGGLSTADTIPTTAAYYTDHGTNNNVDCDFLSFPTRKRPRDDYYHQNLRSSSSFLGQDIDVFSSHINQQQQYEIDRFVSLHMERVKLEIQEKRKRQTKTIMEAIEHGVMKRLRVKEEERERIGKINHALEERVKSLSVENQIWRDLARSNEAAANNLRNNLEQVLAQVKDLRGAGLDNVNEEDDDAQSWCGSSSGEETVRRTVVNKAHDRGRVCRNCGEKESCVLLLPCRHLCLCGVCGSTVHTCPICTSPKNASVHVNMSP